MNLLRRSTVRTFADVGNFIESKTSVVQTSNVGFTSEVSDYLVVHTGPGEATARAAGTETEAADQSCCPVKSQYTDTSPPSPNAVPVTLAEKPLGSL